MSGVALYTQNQAPSSEEVIAEHTPLVKRIAYHLMSRLPPSVQADDLIQAGMIGLLEAARNYDAGQGASFETYAGIRIRGAMLDEIRKGDWAPRSLHRKMRRVAEVVREIEIEVGRDARDAEVAARLEMPLEDYHALLADASGHRIFSFEDLATGNENLSDGLNGGASNPFDDVEKGEFKRHLADAVASLPERERLVMHLYYDEELNLREIGEVLGVSESRICQIHGQAMIRIKARMHAWRRVAD